MPVAHVLATALAVVGLGALGVGSMGAPRGVRWLRQGVWSIPVGVVVVGVADGGSVEQLSFPAGLVAVAAMASFGAAVVELRTPRRVPPWSVVAVSGVGAVALLGLPDGIDVALVAASWTVVTAGLAGLVRHLTRAHPGSLMAARLRTVAVGLTVLALVGVAGTPGTVTYAVGLVLLVVGWAILVLAVQPPRMLQLSLQPTRELAASVDREVGRLADAGHDPSELVVRIAALFGAEAVVLTDGGRVLADVGPARDVAAAQTAVATSREGEVEMLPADDRYVLLAPTGRGGALAVVLRDVGLLLSQTDTERAAAIAERIGLSLDRADTQRRDRVAMSSLRAIDRMRDDFLATLSHELRTPLTSIRGFSEVLREHADKVPEEQRRELLRRVIEKSGQLEDMIGGLLELTAVRGRQRPERLARYDLRDIVDRAVARAHERLLSHEVEVDVPAASVVTDGGALLAILDQLLDNAGKFTPEGTRVRILGRVDDETVELVVADDGPGLIDVERTRVFEPFVRGGDVLTRRTRGAGIGLTIARELARQLGGRLDRLDREGGAAFVVSVARADGRYDGPEQIAAPIAPPLGEGAGTGGDVHVVAHGAS